MRSHDSITAVELRSLIRNKQVAFAGNSVLKIYGRLNCKSGRRLKVKNRVFFISEEEAIYNGYRPCGHCMKMQYNEWKLINLSIAARE